jgi:hypothetical protein
LISIVVEAEKNWERGNFHAKSEVKKFYGSLVGFRPSEEEFCA